MVQCKWNMLGFLFLWIDSGHWKLLLLKAVEKVLIVSFWVGQTQALRHCHPMQSDREICDGTQPTIHHAFLLLNSNIDDDQQAMYPSCSNWHTQLQSALSVTRGGHHV